MKRSFTSNSSSGKRKIANDNERKDGIATNSHKMQKQSTFPVSNNGPSSTTKTLNEYEGYSFIPEDSKQPTQIDIDVISSGDINPEMFFDKYVSKRKPCIIDCLPMFPDDSKRQIPTITPEVLVNCAGDQFVQVERRYNTKETFGQNRTKSRQFVTTISEFIQRLRLQQDDVGGNGGGEMIYLSTQELQEDEGDHSKEPSEKNSNNHHSPFRVPCQQLVDKKVIPSKLDWAGNLMLQACNLWMGVTTSKTTTTDGTFSSGLHHDYHDNFYIMCQGHKEFQIYSPDMAPYMYTYGKIQKIHRNGLISYEDNETLSDGASINHNCDNHNYDDSNNEGREDQEDGEDEGDEEAVVIGKGFDYETDDSGAGVCFQLLDNDDDDDENNNNHRDDFDEIMKAEAGVTPKVKTEEEEEDEKEAVVIGKGFDYETDDSDAVGAFFQLKNDTSTNDDSNDYDDFDEMIHAEEGNKQVKEEDSNTRRPDSFSPIPLTWPREKILEQFPLFASCHHEVRITLRMGQTLYLPASWFHCVTSFSSHNDNDSNSHDSNKNDDNNTTLNPHIAINYWYYPPDSLNNFQNPYQDDFWKQ